MSLSPGTRLGPYDVLGSLGAGGMGEVYRARDTRLNRDVAIKILPEAFASDPDRVARFTREAQTLAALNHPHIAQIYGVEESDPSAGSGQVAVRALVMELVEGETLAERLARGPIPLDDALPIATHIADALQAAHEQAIIHRDLKPANIKVRPDGIVKVLDFGLAKALDQGSGVRGPVSGDCADDLNSPTITTPAMTAMGVILGTAAYMSPEQAKGRAADKRSDVWAFGCVLYEMLTGSRAFEGEDVSETLASVLKSTPDWKALPEATPLAVRTLLRRCLERDRGHRVADVSTVRFVLDEAASLSNASVDEKQPDARQVQHDIDAAVTVARRQLVRHRVVPMAAAMVMAAVVAGVAVLNRPPAVSPRLVTRFSIALPEGQQLSLIPWPHVAISHDGTHLVYHTTERLFIRELSAFDAKPLTDADGTQGVNSPTFSPDDRLIAFYAGAENAIKGLAIGGGAPTTVCRTPVPSRMSWDSTGIIFSTGDGIFRCAPGGGEPEQLARVNAGDELYGPQMLPGGKSLIFSIAKTADGPTKWDKAQIVVHSLTSATQKTIVNGGSDARYLNSGHLLYAVGGVVFAAPFDVERETLLSGPVPILEGVRRNPIGNSAVAQFATSDTGTLIYVPGPVVTASHDRALATANRAGVTTRLNVPHGHYVHTRASRDGARLVVGSDDGKQASVWIYRLDGKSSMRRLTLDGNNRFPIWSPDSQRIAFQSDRGGDPAIFAQRVDGVGGAERLTKPGEGEAHVPESWSPDGKHVIFSSEKSGTYSLRMLSLDDKKSAPYGDVRSTEPINAVFSPDGKWIAYSTGDRGGIMSPTRGVYVQPFPATGAKYQVPQRRLDFHPVWSPDGAELIFIPSAASGQAARVQIMRQEGMTFGSPATFAATVTGDRRSGERRAYDILPDGRFVGFLSAADTGRFMSSEIRVVVHWFDELRQRVPIP